jgi:hypothetical protein
VLWIVGCGLWVVVCGLNEPGDAFHRTCSVRYLMSILKGTSVPDMDSKVSEIH